MADGDGNGNEQWQRWWCQQRQWRWQRKRRWGQKRRQQRQSQLQHPSAICSTVAGTTPCLPPHGHKGLCIPQRCIMGATLQRVFVLFEEGGFLTAHHGFFIYLF